MRKNFLIALIIFIVTACIYIATAPPSIYTGDSGEIATAVYSWGVAHPTGFPAYLILAKLFSYLLPWFEFAFRLNIFSGICAAGTVALVFFICRKLHLGVWASVSASFLLGFGFTFWTHAGTTQVYTITALFFSLAILLLLDFFETKKFSRFYLLAAVCGFGAGAHLTFLLFIPFALLLFILKAMHKEIKINSAFLVRGVVIFLFSCLLVYSYIPLRAAQNPELNWGNPSTGKSFVHYITQVDYADKIGNRSSNSWAAMLGELKNIFFLEFTWLGFIAILIGAVFAFKKFRPLFYAGFSVIFFNVLLLGNYGNNSDLVVLWRYFLPSYVIMVLFFGIAVSEIFVNRKKMEFLALSLPLLVFAFHISPLDRRDHILIPETTRIIFDALPQGSIFIVGGDTITGSTMYAQTVLGKRPDVLLISQPLFTHSWYQEAKKIEMENKEIKYYDNVTGLLKFNGGREAYSLSNSMAELNINYKFFPQAIIYKMYPIKGSADFPALADADKKFWENFNSDFLSSSRVDNETLSKEVVNFYTGALNNFAAYLTNNGDAPGGINYFEKSLAIRENKNALYNLWGIYSASGYEEKAAGYKVRFDNLGN